MLTRGEERTFLSKTRESTPFSLPLSSSMELQIPKGTEPQNKTRKKPLDTPPPAVASSNKPPPPPARARLRDPTPPHSSTFLAEQPADRGNAGEQRKEGQGGEAEQKGPKPRASETTPATAGAATHLQKKLRRAERFGMHVLLTEEEKRNSRAERFGTGSTLHGIQNAGQPEEQKRKARAERFGLKAHSPVDEEAKKKARLERFAPNSTTGTAEEEKRKARAIRFSQTSGTSQANGKAYSELKMASVGNSR